MAVSTVTIHNDVVNPIFGLKPPFSRGKISGEISLPDGHCNWAKGGRG